MIPSLDPIEIGISWAYCLGYCSFLHRKGVGEIGVDPAEDYDTVSEIGADVVQMSKTTTTILPK